MLKFLINEIMHRRMLVLKVFNHACNLSFNYSTVEFASDFDYLTNISIVKVFVAFQIIKNKIIQAKHQGTILHDTL